MEWAAVACFFFFIFLVCLGSIVILVFAGYFAYAEFYKKDGRSENWLAELAESFKKVRVHTITLPKGASWEPERAMALIENLYANFGGGFALRLLVEPGKVLWQVLDMKGFFPDADNAARIIKAIYPEADVIGSGYIPLKITDPIWRTTFIPKLANPFYMPLKPVTKIKNVDPLALLVEAMSGQKEGCRTTLLLYVSGPVDKATWQRAVKRTQHSDETKKWHSFGQAIGAVMSKGRSSYQSLSGTGRTGQGRYIEEEQKLFERKLYDSSLMNAFLILQADATAREYFEQAVNVGSILISQFASTYNAWVSDETLEEQQKSKLVESAHQQMSTSATGLILLWAKHLAKKPRAVLSTEEMASLWHLPHKGFPSREIVWSQKRVPAPPKLLGNTRGVTFGDNNVAGRKVPIRLPDASRKTHINIVGKTGVGKSTFMHNLIHQDIAAGKGVGVVDPHGKLISNILRCSVPNDRVDDLVLIDIGNEKNPPPLNPLATAGGEGRFAAGRVIAVLDKVYGNILNTPRIARTLSAALVSLSAETTPTVRDVTRLFHDVEYRRKLQSLSADEATWDFWEEFERQSPSLQHQMSLPVIYRMETFYGNPTLYPIMCHPDTIDFSDLIARKKIILVSLDIDEELVPGPEKRLLGAVLVSQLQMGAMKSWKEGNHTPFFLYIDEVQNFVTTALNKVFEEALKYGLHLTVANQYLRQLKGKTLDSVMGTVGASVVFQIGLTDARALGPFFRPEFEPDDLANLDLYQAAVKTRFERETLPAFSIETRPEPGDTKSVEARKREMIIRARSVARYTPKTREEVLDWLTRRYPRQVFKLPPKETGDDEDVDWVVS